MTDAFEIKWKDHVYELKPGTIVLFGKPLPEIKNCTFDGRGVVQDATIFAAMVLAVDPVEKNVPPKNRCVWIYCLAYARNRAAIDTFASHGVTLVFDGGDKWLITPEMVADLLTMKPVPLVDSDGRHIRDLVPDNFYNFRISADNIHKGLSMVGSDVRLVDLSRWNARMFKVWLNILGMLDPKRDADLSRQQLPSIEQITDVQKYLASVKAYERIAPKKKAVKVNKGGFTINPHNPNSHGSSYYYNYTPADRQPTKLHELRFVSSISTREVLDRRCTIGKVANFTAVNIDPGLFHLDPTRKRVEIYLERREDDSAINKLLQPGTVLCIQAQPTFFIIDPYWQFGDQILQMIHKAGIFGDGTDYATSGIFINNSDLPEELYTLLSVKFPGYLAQPRPPAGTPRLPVVRIQAHRVRREGSSDLTIELSELSNGQSDSLSLPGVNVILTSGSNSAAVASYIVIPSEFLNSSYMRDHSIETYKASFLINHSPIPSAGIFWIKYTMDNRQAIIRFLMERHQLPPAVDSDESPPPPPEPEVRELALSTSVKSLDPDSRIVLVNYDSLSDHAAERLINMNTVFTVRNQHGETRGRWKTSAEGTFGCWRLRLTSEIRDTALDGAEIYLVRLPDVVEPEEPSEPAIFEPIPEPRHVTHQPATGGVVESWTTQVDLHRDPYVESFQTGRLTIDPAEHFWREGSWSQVTSQPDPPLQPSQPEVRQAGGYMYSIDINTGRVYTDINGVGFTINTTGFIMHSNSGSSTGGLLVTYEPLSIHSRLANSITLSWSAVSSWFNVDTGVRLRTQNSRLADFLDALYGVQPVNTTADHPAAMMSPA